MTQDTFGASNLWTWIFQGWYASVPLLICSVVAWVIIIERILKYRSLTKDLHDFHLKALNLLVREEQESLKSLCQESSKLPTARLLLLGLERLDAKDPVLKQKWREALDRKRQMLNQDLKKNLWILGTVASAAPFIGLYGTVIGILRSFHDISVSGKGGFAVVSAGISEALVATAGGIIVAVIATLAFNTFQTRWSQLVLTIRLQMEEMSEILGEWSAWKEGHGH